MKLKFTKFSLINFLVKNLKSRKTYSKDFFNIVRFWLKGFHTDQIILFNLKKNNYKNYLSESCKHRITLKTNINVWPILHDKLFFDAFMKDKLPVIPALFFIQRGDFNAIEESYSKDKFINRIKTGHSFVIKPIFGGMGYGLFFVISNKNRIKINDKEVTIAEVGEFLKTLEYHACYPYMSQHSEIATLYQKTINTLRVTSYINGYGLPKIFGSILRVGSSETKLVDNFTQGGISVFIEPGEGVTVNAIKRDINNSHGLKVIDRHPDSEQLLTGIKIPYWSDIKKEIIQFHERFPSFDLVGWDVLIGKNGFYFIEGNHNPGMISTFIHKNFSHDKEFKDFFRSRKILC